MPDLLGGRRTFNIERSTSNVGGRRQEAGLRGQGEAGMVGGLEDWIGVVRKGIPKGICVDLRPSGRL